MENNRITWINQSNTLMNPTELAYQFTNMCSYIQPHKNTWNWPLITKFKYWAINTSTWDINFYPKKARWWSFSSKMSTDYNLINSGFNICPLHQPNLHWRWSDDTTFLIRKNLQVGHPLCVMIKRITHTGRWFDVHVKLSQLYLNKTIIIFLQLINDSLHKIQ